MSIQQKWRMKSVASSHPCNFLSCIFCIHNFCWDARLLVLHSLNNRLVSEYSIFPRYKLGQSKVDNEIDFGFCLDVVRAASFSFMAIIYNQSIIFNRGFRDIHPASISKNKFPLLYFSKIFSSSSFSAKNFIASISII